MEEKMNITVSEFLLNKNLYISNAQAFYYKFKLSHYNLEKSCKI